MSTNQSISKLSIKPTNKYIIIIIIIIVLLLIILSSFVFSKPKPANKQPDRASSDKINNALASAGISRPEQENFTSIVFDTKEKVIKNFDLFMNTFYPSLNINEMNNMLKKYGVPNTIQELLIENIDSYGTNHYINKLAELTEFYPSLYSIEFKTGGSIDDIICSTLGSIVIMNTFRELNGNIFYLNDFKDSDDFYIYISPESYDISKVSTMKSEIKEFNEINSKDYYKIEDDKVFIIKPYKIGVFNMSINKAKKIMLYKKAEEQETNIDNVSVSEEELNSTLQSLKDNRDSFQKYLRIVLIKDFIILYTKQFFTESSQIIKDTIELLAPENKHFNENLYKYGYIQNNNNNNILWRFNNDLYGVIPTTTQQTFFVSEDSAPPTTNNITEGKI